MTINVLDNSLKNQLDKSDNNELADYLRLLKFGSLLRAMPTQLRAKAPAADSYNLATLQSLNLPDDARAGTIFRAYAKTTSGAGTLGELAVQAFGATPADGQIAVSPNGQIVVLAASAYTKIDVLYLPEQYDIVEYEVPVTTNVIDLTTVLPAVAAQGVSFILEAEATAGAVTGKKIPLVAGAGAPATLQCRLNLAKTTITFNSGTDAVTKARVKLALSSAVDRDALLTAAASF